MAPLDNYFDKILYINLKKDVARNESMLRQFSKFAITNFERVDACRSEVIPERNQYRNFLKAHPRYVTGQLSCRESHLKCMELATARKYKSVLILEDDVIFLADPNHLLLQNIKTLDNWDMLYFGGDIEAYYRNQIVRTHAYAVKSTLYEDIINIAPASGMEIDNFYAKILQHMSYNHNKSGKYDIRIINPFNLIAPNLAFPSNIQV